MTISEKRHNASCSTAANIWHSLIHRWSMTVQTPKTPTTEWKSESVSVHWAVTWSRTNLPIDGLSGIGARAALHIYKYRFQHWSVINMHKTTLLCYNNFSFLPFRYLALNVHTVCTNFCLKVHTICTNFALNVHTPVYKIKIRKCTCTLQRAFERAPGWSSMT